MARKQKEPSRLKTRELAEQYRQLVPQLFQLLKMNRTREAESVQKRMNKVRARIDRMVASASVEELDQLGAHEELQQALSSLVEPIPTGLKQEAARRAELNDNELRRMLARCQAEFDLLPDDSIVADSPLVGPLKNLQSACIAMRRDQLQQVKFVIVAEMSRRGIAPTTKTASPRGRKRDPVVLVRREIVRRYPDYKNEELCQELDSAGVPTLPKWSAKTWVEAYHPGSPLRSRVDTVLSKDRAEVARRR